MSKANPLTAGETVFIRTVTIYYLGRIVEVVRAEDPDCPAPGFLLEEASWVADTKKFSKFLVGEQDKDQDKDQVPEVEPFPDGVVFVAAGVIVDATRWKHKLPRVAQ